MKWTLKKTSIIVYILSFVLPAFYLKTFGSFTTVWGFHAFLYGPTFIQNLEIYFFCWLANVTFIVSLVAKKGETFRLILALLTIVLTSLLPIAFLLRSEDDGILHAGYFLWVTSFILNVIVAFREFKVVRRRL